MKKLICGILSMTMSFAVVCSVGVTTKAEARVNIEVNIGPPVIVSDEPDEIVYAPGLGVYFVPDGQWDIFYYGGFWWSRHGHHWYRSRYYRNGWGIVGNGVVPAPVFGVPRDYRVRFGRERHIRYKEWEGRPGRPSFEGKGRGDRDDHREIRDHRDQREREDRGTENKRDRSGGNDKKNDQGNETNDDRGHWGK
jgi:hypothetical protein